jgi:hypothetical protein
MTYIWTFGDITRLGMKPLFALVSAVATVLLSGCVAVVAPAPHTTRATPKIHARLIDSTTHQPVSGGTISIPERPEIFATSSQDGCVTLKPTRNFHWLKLWADGDSWGEPSGFRWSRQLEISHTNYDSRLLTLPYSRTNWGTTNLGDILLDRRRE